MKFAAFAVFSLVALTASRADILVNGDFHDGAAHWRGEAHDAGASDHVDIASLTHGGGSAGAVINLGARAWWPHMYQTFNSQYTSFTYSLTFSVSQDYAPKQRSSDWVQSTTSNPFLSYVLGGLYKGDLAPPKGNDFLLVVFDKEAALFSDVTITPKVGTTDTQTVTGTLSHVPAHDEKVLSIVFNHGTGSVTFYNVALTALPDEKKDTNAVAQP